MLSTEIMKLLSVLFVFCLCRISYCSIFIPFSRDFFRFKNIKSIRAVSCSIDGSKMLADWRKDSQELISLQVIPSKSSFPLQPHYDPGEITGLIVNLSCDSSHIIKKLLDEDAVKRKMMAVLWKDTESKASEEISTHLLSSNFIELFMATAFINDSERILVHNGQNELAMMWTPNGGLIDLGLISRPTLSGTVIRGMVTLKDEHRHNTSKLLDILEGKNSQTLTDNLMRFSFVLHQLLETMYDFRWQLHLSGSEAADEIYVSADNSSDYFMEGSQFGALKTGYVDVGMYPAELLPAGLESFEFLPTLTTFRQFFVFSSPIESLEPYKVYSMFSGQIWGITVSLTILLALVSTISAKATAINEEETNELSFTTNILIIVGAIAQQGLERSSEKLSVRITHFFLLLLSLMLYVFYNTGFLMYTLNPCQKEMRFFEDLLSKGYAIAAENTPYNRFQLEGNYSHPTEWFYQNCQNGWGTCKTEVEFYNLIVGAEKVNSGKTAFFGYSSNVYGALEQLMTDRELSAVKELTVHKPFSVGTFVRKFFPYKEHFARGLLLLKEAGIAFHEDQKWNFKKPDPLVDSYFVVASLYSTSVAFMLIFAGILGSLSLLLLEIFIKHRQSRAESDDVVHKMKRFVNSQLV